MLSVFQNLSQISERWGRDRAETVMANHVARLFGSGIADRATLDYLGAVLGEEEIEKVSTHRQRLELDLGSRTYSKDFKRLAAPDRVRQAERDTALLVYGNIAPAWISLRPWYRDRGLRAQSSDVGGDVEHVYRSEGVRCKVEIPATWLSASKSEYSNLWWPA